MDKSVQCTELGCPPAQIMAIGIIRGPHAEANLSDEKFDGIIKIVASDFQD